MRRRKGSLWGSKKASKPSSSSSSSRKEKAASRPEPTAEVPIDWGQFYDKLSTRGNSRGQCVDDLVLLEDVSNEGIVEVSADDWARAGCPGRAMLSKTVFSIVAHRANVGSISNFVCFSAGSSLPHALLSCSESRTQADEVLRTRGPRMFAAWAIVCCARHACIVLSF